MRKITQLILFIFLLFFIACKEPFKDQYYQLSYSNGHVWVGTDIIEMKSGDFAFVGETTAYGSEDMIFGVIDQFGNPIYTKLIKADSIDQAMGLTQTSDDGFLITGQSNSFGPHLYDVAVIKLNKSYDVEWSKILGGYNFDYGNEVMESEDGTYVVTGYTYSFGDGEDDLYIVKFNREGDTLWTKMYGGKMNEHSQSITSTSDGGYIIAGHTANFSNGYYDTYVVRTDKDGDTVWTRTYGDIYHDRGQEIVPALGGGFIVAGGSEVSKDQMDMKIMKIDENGKLEWVKTYGGDNADILMSVTQSKSGDIYACGWTKSIGNGANQITIKTDKNGKLLWSFVIADELEGQLLSCIESKNGDVFVIGKYVEEIGSPYIANIMKLKADGSSTSCKQKQFKNIKIGSPNFHTNYTSTKINRGMTIRDHTFEYRDIDLNALKMCEKN